jgi:toxin-antitoxin system PIN domain toxin
MIAVDTSVLVAAHRAELPRHRDALARLGALAEGPGAWGVPVFCLAEFVRVVTHRRILSPPSQLAQALGFLEALEASPSYRALLPEAGFGAELVEVLRRTSASGTLALSAQVAALCATHGASLLTDDKDMARFGIDVIWL